MKKGLKALMTALCAVLLVVASIMGTLAYLTSTDQVTNTFTVGKVAIKLDEAKVKEDGTVDGTERVGENAYKLMPGHEYTKDPTIHVAENSEDCWLFVKVEDEIKDIEDATTVADQLTANGWTAVSGAENVYTRAKFTANTQDKHVKVFESFKIKGEVTGETLDTYEDKSIKVTAYAVQADGFDTAAEAWTASNFETNE